MLKTGHKNKTSSPNASMRGIRVVLRKELADYFNSLRFLLLMGIILATSVLAAYSGIANMRELSAGTDGEYAFLLLFTNAGGSVPSVVSFLSFLGPVVGLVLGFDSINGERARGSLSRVLSQPIYRDTVINAKFLAGVGVISIIMTCLWLGIMGMGILLTGLVPTASELVRMVLFLAVTILHIALWLAVSILFSIVFRQSSTSSLCSIGVWIFMSIFVGVISTGAAGFFHPVTGSSSEAVLYANERLAYLITRISPSVLYGEAVNILLNPMIRTIGPITSLQLDGMVSGFLPLRESLLLIWPHVVGIIAAGTACFAAAYIIFSRQEIRA